MKTFFKTTLFSMYFIIMAFAISCNKDSEATPQPTQTKPASTLDSLYNVQWVFDSTKTYQFLAEPEWKFSANYYVNNYTIWVSTNTYSVWVKLPATNFYWTGDSIWQQLGAIYYKRNAAKSPPIYLGVKIYHP